MSRRPLYCRLLALRHVRPNAWQRALLAEGTIALAAILVLADLATAWTLLVLPLAVALVVKAHDLLAGVLTRTGPRAAPAVERQAADVPQPTDRPDEHATAARLTPPHAPGTRMAPPH